MAIHSIMLEVLKSAAPAMLTFEQFLREETRPGEAINLMFEERLFGLVEILHKVAEMFAMERIRYELIGGMAVAAQIYRVDPAAVMLTRDLNVMIDHSDLESVQEAASRYAFEFRHTAGLDMLLYAGEKKAIKGVHLLFSGETVKPGQEPNPALAPERIEVYGTEISIVSVPDLVRMKLNSYRDKDRVHVRAMDEVGLITPGMEQTLSAEHHARLQHIRNTE